MRVLLLALLALGACTTFAPIEPNVCGNGILEPGEDCDTPDTTTCVACAIVCSLSTDCPAAYACGVDHTCHAPGGQLPSAKAIDTVAVSQFQITDVDHDGIGDFIGLSPTSVTVRHGDAASPLATNESFVTPSQTGAAAFGDLDDDGSTDFMIATPDGLVAYTSKYGDPSPVAIPSSLGPKDSTLQIVSLISLQPTVVGLFAIVPAVSPDVQFLVLDLADTSVFAGASPLCALHLTPATLDLTSVQLYDATTGSGSTLDTELVLSFLGGPAASRRACVLAIHIDPPTGVQKIVNPTFYPITPTGVGTLTTKPMLAHLDLISINDNCPHLVIQDGGPQALQAYDGTIATDATKHCTLVNPTLLAPLLTFPLESAPPDSVVVGRFPVDPVFLGFGADAIVTNAGVWLYVPKGVNINNGTTLTGYPTGGNFGYPLYISTRPLKGVAFGDLNGDGLFDAALIPDGEDDLDVLLRHTMPDGYEFLRVDTATEVTSLTVRDFDGNGIVDLAYTEHAGDHDRLSIAYATTDQLLPPIEVATFDSVTNVTPISVPSSADPLSLSADLIVTVGTATPLQTSLLLGSPNRTMIPVLDPRTGANAMANGIMLADLRDTTTFRGIAIGAFSPTVPQYADAVVLATRNRNVGATGVGIGGTTIPEVSGWEIKGSATGFDTQQTIGNAVGEVTDCTSGEPAAMDVCADAIFVPFPITGGRDLVLGIDRFAHFGVVDPTAATIGATTTNPVGLISGKVGDAVVHDLFAADLDGDGAPELVATFAAGATATGAVLECTVATGTAIPSTCHDVGKEFVMPTDASILSCVDAAAGHFGFQSTTSAVPKGLDLVVACETKSGTALFRVELDANNKVTKLAHGLPAKTALIHAGDVNGDGVDDLVIIHGDPGSQTLTVLQQCTSRDVGCQEAP